MEFHLNGHAILKKLKDVVMAVLPITIIVLLLHFTILPLATDVLIRFLMGAVLIVFGLTTFLLGIDLGITPLGKLSGNAIAKSKKLWLIIISGLILGFFISIAEPGLLVLSNEVNSLTNGLVPGLHILLVVSVGMSLMLAIGFIRMLFSFPLHYLLLIIYGIIAILSLFASREFLAIAFDASGATTGVLAVPFILALSTGVIKLKRKGEPSEEDNFGLVAIASGGAIIGVLVLQLFTSVTEFTAHVDTFVGHYVRLLDPFFYEFTGSLREAIMALSPLIVILVVLQFIAFKLKKAAFFKILLGFVLAFIGLGLFLIGVNGGFMQVGQIVGIGLVELGKSWLLIVMGFILGFVIMMAEPAVYVLTHEVEEITEGKVKSLAVLMALCLGVGAAIALSMLRIVTPEIQLWWYLLPGYVIAFILSFIVPKLFVGMAFDAGGVATGPMTATFILTFTTGVAHAYEGSIVLIDGFGMIATVAMMPIIALQILGLFSMKKEKLKN